MITRIHVNKQRLAANRKYKKNDPVITVKTYKSNIYCKSVKINGPSQLVYRPEKPLSCGAVCWIETEAEVEISSQ